MRVGWVRKPVLFLVLVFAASALFADGIRNWSAPATWRPTAAGGAHTLGDVTNALPFIGLDPCRILDTRGNGAPIQGGMFAASELRNYAVAGICAIPTAARALSLNITVTGPGQTGAGFLLAFPTGGVPPPVSSLNWDHAPATVGNAAVVPTNSSVSFAINVSGPTHVIIDVNGYYPTGSSGNLLNLGQHFDVSGNTDPPFGMITTRNNSTATGAMGFFGIAGGTSGEIFGVVGELETSSANGSAGVRGFDPAGGSLNGFSNNWAVSGVQGVFGGSGNGYGVLGVANGTSGYAGLFGRQNTTSPFSFTSYAAFAGSSTQAGTFIGNVSVSGTLSKGGGAFKIDHPLDPENKYLYHSFVESPDMMNIYNGVVTLDGSGEATVELPDYFEKLNRDFRYQLTSIGRAQPGLYIAEEVQDLKFRIAGGKAHAKVSWQITGIRQDPFANAHRIQVIEEKEKELRGTFLHAVEYGQPADKSESYTRGGELIQAGQRAREEN